MKLKNLALISVFLLAVLLFLLPYTALAQETSEPTPLPDWVSVLPAALAALVLTNYRVTEAFRRMLASPNLGWTPPKDVAGVITLVFSALFGIFLAWITPHATDWLTSLNLHPALAIAFTGISISALGGVVYEFTKRLGAGAIYETKTTISAPPSDLPPVVASKTMEAVSQAASSQG